MIAQRLAALLQGLVQILKAQVHSQEERIKIVQRKRESACKRQEQILVDNNLLPMRRANVTNSGPSPKPLDQMTVSDALILLRQILILLDAVSRTQTCTPLLTKACSCSMHSRLAAKQLLVCI